MSRVVVSVLEVRQESEDIRSFRLGSDGLECLPEFTAGSHIDVEVPGGYLRQYSLLGDPLDRDSYWIAVKNEPASRGGSAAMNRDVKVGDRIRIGLPRNNFPLADTAEKHILLAGGIGITPMLSMMHALRRAGKAFHLYYFARSPAHAGFESLLGEGFKAHTTPHHGRRPDEVGHILEEVIASAADGTHVYICGPAPFIEKARSLAAAKLPANAIHTEFFVPGESAQAGDDDPFDVELARSGRIIEVGRDETLIEALRSQGVEIETSCEQGVCGTCVTDVLEGEPDHRDFFLMDDEKAANTKMCVCVSRSKTKRLVLDL